MFRSIGKKNIWLPLLLLTAVACKRKWSDDDKVQFVSGCIGGGALRDLGETKAKAYCNCMLQKAMARYPNANDARYMRQDTAMARLAQDCLKQP